jgi:hypothetical protein
MSNKKGIVLETGKGWAIILMPDGQYKKVRTNRMLAVGELYNVPSHIPQYIAAAVLLVFLTVGIVDYFSVVAYARLSPGIEIGINRWEKVVLVQKDHTWNELDKLKLKGKSLDDAVVTIVDEVLSSEEPAVADWQQGLTVSVISSKVETGEKVEEKLEGKLIEKIDVALEKAAERKTRNSKHYRIQRENNNLVIMAEKRDAVAKSPKEEPPGFRQKDEKDRPDKENKTEKPTKPSKRESNPGKISPDLGAKPAKTEGELGPTDDNQRTNLKNKQKDKERDTVRENNQDQKQQKKEKSNKDNQKNKDKQKDDKDKQKDKDYPGQRDKGKNQDKKDKDQGNGERKDSSKIPFPWKR